MTLIHIENLAASRKVVKVVEDFGAYSVHRVLLPGEMVRLPVGVNKQVTVVETAAEAEAVTRHPARPSSP